MQYLRELLYISPKFPALSLVFEQNEIIGIQNCGVNITVASCRNGSFKEAHKFVIPLLKNVIYPSYKDIFFAVVLLLFKSPKALLSIIKFTFTTSLNPRSIISNLAALLITLALYPTVLNRKPNFDWIHADFGQGTATVALMLSKLLNCSFSFKVHAFDIYDKKLLSLDLLKNTKVKQADLIFSEHKYGKKELMQLFSVPNEKILVNYTSIRPNDFHALAPVLASKRFVALGRLVLKKGFDILIEASAILHQQESFTVDIYGAGPEESNLKKIIARNHLQDIVFLKGKYKNENLPNMLVDCIALIMPSVMDKNGDMDGIPTVIYEAMSLGRTVIASEISGIPEVVKHQINGYLIKPGNSQELAERMKDALQNPEIAARMGKSGRNLVELNHNYDLNAKQFIDAIEFHISKK